MTEGQSLALVAALGSLVLVGSGLFARRLPVGATLKMALAWVGIFAVGFVLFAMRDDFVRIWNRVTMAATGESREAGGAVRIPISEDGHFHVVADVNGRPVRFLVDSGATITAMSRDAAIAAGVTIDSTGFPVAIDTANGTVMARRGRIAQMAIGGIATENHAITVSEELGDTNLLGMNWLSTLDSWRVEGSTLVLQP